MTSSYTHTLINKMPEGPANQGATSQPDDGDIDDAHHGDEPVVRGNFPTYNELLRLVYTGVDATGPELSANERAERQALEKTAARNWNLKNENTQKTYFPKVQMWNRWCERNAPMGNPDSDYGNYLVYPERAHLFLVQCIIPMGNTKSNWIREEEDATEEEGPAKKKKKASRKGVSISHLLSTPSYILTTLICRKSLSTSCPITHSLMKQTVLFILTKADSTALMAPTDLLQLGSAISIPMSMH
ncbi:hypothetical protein DFS34DRAFT_78073 [Phlyctochytrium arcticum]|nr:hypothetical protein DFS34DRAFT_78073 [Phlyctochytrium arcticum]